MPAATIAVALGASRSNHSEVVIGCPVAGIVTEAAPVALVLDLLVGDRAFDDEDERFQLAAVGFAEPLEEVVLAAGRATLEVDQRPMHRDLRKSGERTECDLLDARLGRGSQRDGVPVATEAGVDPQDVDERFFCLYGGGRRHRCHLSRPGSAPIHAAGADDRPTCAASLFLTFGPELRQAIRALGHCRRRATQPGIPGIEAVA